MKVGVVAAAKNVTHVVGIVSKTITQIYKVRQINRRK